MIDAWTVDIIWELKVFLVFNGMKMPPTKLKRVILKSGIPIQLFFLGTY